MAWLRKNVQAGRRKPTNNEHPVPPLNVPRFYKWVNEELLKETLTADARRKPICEYTACRWLHVPSISMIYSQWVSKVIKNLDPNYPQTTLTPTQTQTRRSCSTTRTTRR